MDKKKKSVENNSCVRFVELNENGVRNMTCDPCVQVVVASVTHTITLNELERILFNAVLIQGLILFRKTYATRIKSRLSILHIHSIFNIRILFFRPRLNILIFIPISG